MTHWILLCIAIMVQFYKQSPGEEQLFNNFNKSPYLIVLGTAQDGGYPQAGCMKICCQKTRQNRDLKRYVVSLALVDPMARKTWLLEATPDFKDQLALLNSKIGEGYPPLPESIFLTHAHIGHYTGLIHLGREAMGADLQQVYVMPRMKAFLKSNGPWDLLVNAEHIALKDLAEDKTIHVSSNLKLTPIVVPHRDEYSETVGFLIQGPEKKVLFIPDIDKWSKWDNDITDLVKSTDIAFVDGTFYDQDEIPWRNMAEIPHPFVVESIALFDKEPREVKQKIYFIHLNHTNPLLDKKSKAYSEVINNGFSIAVQGQKIPL